MTSTCIKHFCSILKYNGYLEEKHLCFGPWKIQVQIELAIFFTEYYFYMKKWLAYYVLRFAYLADIFSKNEQSEAALQIKQMTAFVAMIKNQAFKQKLKFWKTYIYHYKLDSFPNT